MNTLTLSEVIKKNAPTIIKNYFGEFEHYRRKSSAVHFADSINHLFDNLALDFDWSRRECLEYLNSLMAKGPKIFDGFIRYERSIKQEAWVIADFKAAKARWAAL